MSQYYDSNTRTFTSAAVMSRYLRVKTTGGLVLAGASDVELGVLDAAVVKIGDPATVLLRTKRGTTPMVAAGAIAVDAEVFGAANGQVANSGTVDIGKALTSATAAGDIIEVLRN